MLVIDLNTIYLLLGSLLYSILSALVIGGVILCFFINGLFGDKSVSCNIVYLTILGVVTTILNLYITFNGFTKIFME